MNGVKLHYKIYSAVQVMKMDRSGFIKACDTNLKAVRTEFSFNQEKMAYILGISKKTLVEIEKERSSLGWSGSVTLCSIFHESSVLNETFGDVFSLIHEIAFENSEPNYRKANTTRIWWHTVSEKKGFIIEQNIVSQHYRLVAPDNSILASSFDLDDLLKLIG